jgi:hypothetical protein
MKKFYCLLGLLLISTTILFAQSPARATIKGSICDSAGLSVPSAMIMLLSAKDSTLLNFTQADEKGGFEFKGLKNSGYLLKISHMSYLPYQKLLGVSASDVNDMGKITLKLISKQLMEVVIKAARAPLKFRGDTIEYDAASFKVPPGSTVEDLLRRLPGLDVDVDGNIKSQGKDVKRVYVEGKTFFGDDPKSVTKNLGAETISKVQVFDEKSEQSKLTGISDGIKEKAMNLALKDEFKQGAFGKLTAAAGDQGRWAGRGSYNRFNKTSQLSFIGYGNNINQTGVNWEDYGEFKGQNTFMNYDNGDFGFGNGGGMMMISMGDNMNGFDGRGLTNNYGGGVNYNFDNKKTKFNSSYLYNQTARTLEQTSDKETFLQNSSFKNADTTQGKDFRGNHSIGLRLEQNIDSADVLITKANIKFSKSTDNSSVYSAYSDATNALTRSLKTITDNHLDSWDITSAAIFRHRFKKKGASFAWSGGFNTSKTDGLDLPFSLNRFFQANTNTEQMQLLSSNNNNKITQFKSSMLLTEPISKKVFWEAFYNFNATGNTQDRLTNNESTLYSVSRIDSLSAYYTNNVLYNRVGSSLRYSNVGLNASAGIAVQQLQLKGNYAIQKDMPDLQAPINKTYFNLIPNISLGYQVFKTTYLNASYSYNVTEPTIQQLMPITNVNNIAYRIEGNPNLQPQRSHSFNLSTTYWNQASMSSIYMGMSYQKYVTQIVYNQNTVMVPNVGLQTVSRPENVKGGNSISLYMGSNFPLIKTKLTMNISGGINASTSPTFINNIENVTRNFGYNVRTSFNLTPSPKLVMGINGSLNFNDISYSFRKEQNQKIRNYTASYSAKYQFATKSYFETNFNYAVYRNAKFGFNRDIPMLNASVRQIFGKTNRIEMRLAAFDIFNRNQSISQTGAANYIYRSQANTLARYFMLSLSYNIKGFETKINKPGGMMIMM